MARLLGASELFWTVNAELTIDGLAKTVFEESGFTSLATDEAQPLPVRKSHSRCIFETACG
ncbi:hypothetical protein [Paraburkholderia diazotrophica]|uniref:hypothetical protein n=1 Tax=Paraburkholderia diazotrophica TaxID=667676 RepID=UPI00316E2897